MFFEKAGRVWDTLRELERRLGEAGLDYVVIGGLALAGPVCPVETVPEPPKSPCVSSTV